MRSFLYRSILIVVAFVTSGCDDEKRFYDPNLGRAQAVDIFLDEHDGKLICVTYHTRGIVRLPVWQVYVEENGEATVLFTVERVWQESEPGFPLLSPDRETITDTSGSYEFSISQNEFLNNNQEEVVYLGGYRR